MKSINFFHKMISLALPVIMLGSFGLAPLSAGADQPNVAKENSAPVCPSGGQDSFRCHARVVLDEFGKPAAKNAPSGYGPAQFLGAYGVTGTTSINQTIAVVDAYDDPSILSDLNTYSANFGIPKMVSGLVADGTPATPYFQKVDQRGGTAYPAQNSGWDLEIALDVEIAHAMCQNCNILLVEADSNSYTNLFAAVDQAGAMGATVISNSYGSSEFSGETSYDSHLNHPGIAITFSSGDSGYGPTYPAASNYVTAVGGTTLTLSGNSYVSESAWSGGGSGCSAYEAKSPWQLDTLCLNRTIADVSADADPNTGAAIYDSVRYQGQKGWFKVGGTSLSSPIVAGIYALAGGVGASVQGNSLPYLQSTVANLHDVVSGSNGSCGGTYLCTAVNGYDGPTGLGSPHGATAF